MSSNVLTGANLPRVNGDTVLAYLAVIPDGRCRRAGIHKSGETPVFGRISSTNGCLRDPEANLPRAMGDTVLAHPALIPAVLIFCGWPGSWSGRPIGGASRVSPPGPGGKRLEMLGSRARPAHLAWVTDARFQKTGCSAFQGSASREPVEKPSYNSPRPVTPRRLPRRGTSPSIAILSSKSRFP